MILHEITPSRIGMLPEFMDGGENGKPQRQHYPPSSYRDPQTPPEICPKCGTKTHVEFDIVYCRDRIHSWAVPIPDDKPFDWKKYDRVYHGPKPGMRIITCEFCKETKTGMYAHYQKYCSLKCYEDARRIKNREAYRKKGSTTRYLGN